MDSQDRIGKAREMFLAGHLCSQAVLAAYCDCFDLDQATALRIACGFGSGIARRQEICGAVSGAIMVAGLKLGRVEAQDLDAVERTYEAVRDIIAKFTEQHGTILCRELLGCDISLPEARREAAERGLFATKCAGYVADGARLAAEICGR